MIDMRISQRDWLSLCPVGSWPTSRDLPHRVQLHSLWKDPSCEWIRHHRHCIITIALVALSLQIHNF